MGRIQPTTDSNTEEQATDHDTAEEQEQVSAEEQSTEQARAHVHAVLTAAADATDPATGTVPLAHVAHISGAVKGVRGNARVEAVSTWSVGAFTGGDLDPMAISAVINVANNPASTRPATPTMPDHEVLAYRLALLELAADKLMADAGDEVTTQAIEFQTSESFELPTNVADRADKVAKEASKGTGRRTSSGGHAGPRADLAALLSDAMAEHDLGDEVAFADVKASVVAAGGSGGGALDNRFSALVEATADHGAGMTSATRSLFDQGIRAVSVGEERYLYKVATDAD